MLKSVKFWMVVIAFCACAVESAEKRGFNYSLKNILHSKEFSNEDDKKAAIKNLKLEYEFVSRNNEKFTAGKSNFKQSVYDFSYLPPETFYEKYTGLKILDSKFDESRKSREISQKCENLPENFDWVSRGKIPEVKDQKGCGSSYLQAAVSAVESSISIRYKIPPVKLSTQHILECVKNVTEGDLSGCSGGYSELIWRYSKEQGGLVPENAYKEYDGYSEGECIGNVTREIKSQIDYWSLLAADNEDDLKCHVAKTGPIVVGISITGTSLPRYSEGIYDDPENACTANNPINHAVLLVGYGKELNKKGEMTNFWLLQNSWGVNWGNKGYFKMVRGRNLCKIARYPRFPVLKPESLYDPLQEITTPEICETFEDIFVNKTYKKSYCAVKFPQTYEDARVTCLKNGMRLFQHTPGKSVEFNFTKIGLKTGVNMFIDGQNEIGCNSINNNNELEVENCGQLAWSFCEYLNIDPFKQVLQSIEKPSICADSSLVYNKHFGYFKTLCLVQQNMNYFDANSTCINNRMQLYQIDSYEAERTVMNFTQNLLMRNSISFYVKGKRQDKCAMVTRDVDANVLKFGSCEKLSWFFCELKESLPPKNYLLPMYPPPDCVSTGEVYISNVYNRSFCLIDKLLNYDEARLNCLAIGMRLFTIRSTDDIRALVKYSSKRWTTNVVVAHVGRDDLSLCTNINNQRGSFLFETEKCFISALSFCEYVDIENEPPLTPIKTPCSETQDVYTSSNAYEKTICLVIEPQNYTESWKNCLNNGMQLYRIDSPDSKTALLNFANRKCTKGVSNSIFFKGRRGSDCSVLSKAQGMFYENYGKCARESWSVCEFINTNVPQRSLQSIRPAICSTVGEVRNPLKAYQKSFCVVEWPQNFNDSLQHCIKNGMKLFKFDTSEANATIIEFTRSHVQKTSYFYLDGLTENGCMNINNFNKDFSIGFSDCSSLMYSICEFFAETQLVANSTAAINSNITIETAFSKTPAAGQRAQPRMMDLEETTELHYYNEMDSTIKSDDYDDITSLSLTTLFESELTTMDTETMDEETTMDKESTTDAATAMDIETKTTTNVYTTTDIETITEIRVGADITTDTATTTDEETTTDLETTSDGVTAKDADTTMESDTKTDTETTTTNAKTTTYNEAKNVETTTDEETTTTTKAEKTTTNNENMEKETEAEVTLETFGAHKNSYEPLLSGTEPQWLVEELNEEVASATTVSPILEEIKAVLMQLKVNNLLHSHHIFSLALKIKRALTSTLEISEKHELLKLKSELPKVVQILIWNEEAFITNEKFPIEFLYASTFYKDDDKRFAFSWIPGGEENPKSPFVFSTFDDGLTFKIKSVYANEFLYPDAILKDSSRRYVFTWRRKTLEPSFFWNVEILGDDKIRLKSSTYNEYLYAENSTYGFNINRRMIYTGMSGQMCDESCNWILKFNENSTSSPEADLYDEIENELYRLKINNLTHSPDIFPLALRIKEAMTAKLSIDNTKKFSALKSQLPKCVQILIWKVQTVIKNEAFANEFLYAADILLDYNRRHVFSWIPGTDPNSKSPWIFSTNNGGETFSIKSFYSNEFLYSDEQLDESSRRNVFLWKLYTTWIVEILGDNKIRIKSEAYNEYLYAGNSSHASGNSRRLIFTGMRDNSCDKSCNWVLEV